MDEPSEPSELGLKGLQSSNGSYGSPGSPGSPGSKKHLSQEDGEDMALLFGACAYVDTSTVRARMMDGEEQASILEDILMHDVAAAPYRGFLRS